MAKGRELLAQLRAHVGDRIRLPDGVFSQTFNEFPNRVRVRAVGEEYALIDPDREWPNQNVWTAAFGLSTGLAFDLVEWGEKYAGQFDDETATASDPERFAAEFNREGRALAFRLASELGATGRGYIEVSFETQSGAVEVIHAPGGRGSGADTPG